MHIFKVDHLIPFNKPFECFSLGSTVLRAPSFIQLPVALCLGWSPHGIFPVCVGMSIDVVLVQLMLGTPVGETLWVWNWTVRSYHVRAGSPTRRSLCKSSKSHSLAPRDYIFCSFAAVSQVLGLSVWTTMLGFYVALRFKVTSNQSHWFALNFILSNSLISISILIFKVFSTECFNSSSDLLR